MEPFHPSDVAHPILCPSTQCSFSFCCHCIETMTTTHHHHPTHNLPCPNCRSPLQTTLYDTLLLRKVDKAEDTTTPRGGSRAGRSIRNEEDDHRTCSSEWKKAMHVDVAVLKEIADARDREAKAWKLKTATSEQQQVVVTEARHDVESDCRQDRGGANHHNTPQSPLSSPGDEWGFEVDVRIGPHASIKLPHAVTMLAHAEHNTLTPYVDKTLLAGLESAMTRTEQVRVTRWLTSGDPHALLRAAQAMAVVVHRVYTKHHSTTANSSCSISATTRTTGGARAEPCLSIYEVIHASRTARRKGHSSGRDPAPSSSRKHNKKKQPYGNTIQHFRRQQSYLRHYPLPSRMPKCVRLPRHDTHNVNNTMSLVHDTWDGTLADVFGRSSPTWISHTLRLDTPTLRWIVARAPPGQQHGIVPGDVLTHVNGIEIKAPGPASSWMDVVNEACRRSSGGSCPTEEEEDTVEWVFNADRSVAEALKLRAAMSSRTG